MFRRRNYYIVFLLASSIYVAGTLLAPLTPNRFNLTTAKTHLIQVSIALPILLIWAFALYGAERFKNYTQGIKNDSDGRALDKIATGVTILVLSIIVNGLFGLMRGWALRDGWISAFIISANITAAFVPVIAYSFMFVGANELRQQIRKKIPGIRSNAIVTVVIVTISIIYLAALFNYQYRNLTPNPAKHTSFYMPDILILIMLAVPYLVGWWLGIKAAFNLVTYQQNVKGVIYRAALKRLAIGMLAVIAFAVLLQMLVAFSTFFAEAGVAAILLVVYLIIICYAAGFIIIASGARKLNSIEKVR